MYIHDVIINLKPMCNESVFSNGAISSSVLVVSNDA